VFSKWPIRRKLLICLALLVVIVATLSASGLNGVYAYRSLVKSLSWRVTELPLAAELSQRVGDLRITVSELRGTRDFTAVEAARSPVGLEMTRHQFRLNLQAVQTTLAKYREQLHNNEHLNVGIGDSQLEQQTVRKIEIALERIDEANADEQWMFERVKVDRLAAELEDLQTLAAELPRHLHEKIHGFAGEVRGQYRTLIILSWIASVASALLAALFVRLFYQWIFRPLRVLIEGSRKVAGGQFQYRIALETDDEMAELAEAMNDMTSRFQAIRDDLDRQVRERTKEVVRSEQLASVGFLAAGVAHEINNPLASIAMCAESLESRMAEILNDGDSRHAVIRQYLGMIQNEAFRCKGITEKLLDFSRLGEVRRQNTDLRELVQGVIDMIGHLGKYHQKRIELVPGEPVIAPVNAQEIKQVVLNLVTNALDSLEPEGWVRIEVASRNGQVEMLFTDNGCGMTPEVLEHLFEPFFTRRRSGQGTGLGLSIAYRILADHDGHIEAASEGPGRGARFSIRLPLAESPKETHHRHQAA
jgi:two-component system, NtrC family, sensor kinase